MTARFLRNWMPVLIWMLTIFTASTDLMSAEHTSRFIGPLLQWLLPDLSAAAVVAVQFFIRKLAHLTEYAVLAALLWRAFRGSAGSPANISLSFAAFAIASLFAMTDEYHQTYVASRTGSPRDVGIDACGAAIGLLLYWFFVVRMGAARNRASTITT